MAGGYLETYKGWRIFVVVCPPVGRLDIKKVLYKACRGVEKDIDAYNLGDLKCTIDLREKKSLALRRGNAEG